MNPKEFVKEILKRYFFTLEIEFVLIDFQNRKLKEIPKKEKRKKAKEIENIIENTSEFYSENFIPSEVKITIGKKAKIRIECYSDGINEVIKDLQNAFIEKFKCPYVNVKVKHLFD
jgi:hypothetical protein